MGRAQEFVPSRPFCLFRSRFDPALPHHVGDGASADVMIQVGKCTLNSRIAARAALGRHPARPLANLLRGAGRPGPRRK